MYLWEFQYKLGWFWKNEVYGEFAMNEFERLWRRHQVVTPSPNFLQNGGWVPGLKRQKLSPFPSKKGVILSAWPRKFLDFLCFQIISLKNLSLTLPPCLGAKPTRALQTQIQLSTAQIASLFAHPKSRSIHTDSRHSLLQHNISFAILNRFSIERHRSKAECVLYPVV